MALWWQCVERNKVKQGKHRAIEEEFESIAAALDTTFYRTRPPSGHPVFLPLLDKAVPRSTILRDPTLLGSIDSTLRKRLTEHKIDPRSYAETFFADLEDFEYASIPQRVKPVALTTDQDVVRLLKPITSDDDFRFSLHHILFSAEAQRAVATDSYVLVTLPWHVTRASYGLHRTTGEEIPGNEYPNWPSIVPITATVQSVPLALERLMGRVQSLVNLSRIEALLPSSKRGVWGRLRIGDSFDITFNALILVRAVAALLKAGVRSVVLRGTVAHEALLLVDVEDARRFALVMPVRNDGGVPVGEMLRVTAAAHAPDFTGIELRQTTKKRRRA